MHCGTSDMIGLRLMYIGRIQRFEKGINFHSPPSAKTNVKPVEACFLTFDFVGLRMVPLVLWARFLSPTFGTGTS